MSDIPGFKNIRLMAQQPVAIGEMSLMKAIGFSQQLDKRYTLEVTFETDLVVNVPLDVRLYSLILDELKRQPGVGLEQRMVARSAIASAGAEKAAPREEGLPLDATGEQVYDALRAVAQQEKKEPAHEAPALEEATDDDTQGLFGPDDLPEAD
jgi:hypothetical protein